MQQHQTLGVVVAVLPVSLLAEVMLYVDTNMKTVFAETNGVLNRNGMCKGKSGVLELLPD